MDNDGYKAESPLQWTTPPINTSHQNVLDDLLELIATVLVEEDMERIGSVDTGNGITKSKD